MFPASEITPSSYLFNHQTLDSAQFGLFRMFAWAFCVNRLSILFAVSAEKHAPTMKINPVCAETESIPKAPREFPRDTVHGSPERRTEDWTQWLDAVRRELPGREDGSFVRGFARLFGERMNIPYAVACSSGTAAFHAAVAAIDPEPGDEVVASPMIGMGAIGPILYQGGIPVFADVDPETYNLTAATIQRVLSHRTRAILVTHLLGNPCDMRAIMALAKKYEIPVIEDCSQAMLASSHGRLVGTHGDLGCFSLKDGRHITTGEGGIVVTSDPGLARRVELFVNKASGDDDHLPDHFFLALNYRMNEITGAVATAQLSQLDESLARRIGMAELLTELLGDIPGIRGPQVEPSAFHTYGKYGIDVDPEIIPGGPDEVARWLRENGFACAPGHLRRPIFQCEAIRDQRTFGNSRFPFTFARGEALDYRPERYPGTFTALARMLVLPWHDRIEESDVRRLAETIRQGVDANKGCR